MWTTEEQARLTKYMDGDYADICEWSAYTATPNAFKLPHLDWTVDSVSSDDKALVAKIHDAIASQPVLTSTLYRFERAFHNEDLYINGQEGDLITLPIRSTSRIDLMAKIDRQEGV